MSVYALVLHSYKQRKWTAADLWRIITQVAPGKCTQAGDDAIDRSKFGCAFEAPLYDHQLVFHEQ